MNPSFWHNRRVLVTGHTGFKGAWLCLWLRRLGAEVAGYALPPPDGPSLFALADVGGDVASRAGDVRDLEGVAAVVREFRPEVVIHMAAQALVRASYADPVGTYATNVMGTVNVLEAVRRAGGVRAVVVVTTDKCYENREWVWGYREDEPMGGFDPYSNSKGCAELVTSAYRRSFFPAEDYARHGTAIASARAGNVIGGGDWAEDRLIPDAARAWAAGETVVVRSPGAIRPWQFVLEPLRGYLTLAERLVTDGPAFAEGWNFGPDDADARPVRDVIGRMAGVWGHGAAWRIDDRPQPHEAHYLKLDISKARARLGWNPALSLSYAVNLTARWYVQHSEGVPARDLCLADIARYEKRAGFFAA